MTAFNVTHILSDGTVLNSIDGHVISNESCQGIYDLMRGVIEESKGQKESVRECEHFADPFKKTA